MRGVLIVGLASVLAYFLGHLEGRQAAGSAVAASEQARKVEHAQGAAFNTADRELLDKWRSQSNENDRVIAGLRAGTVRLRQRLAARVPDASAGAGQRDASAAGGLRPADAAFLVRLATEADRNTEQLAACQRLLNVERTID